MQIPGAESGLRMGFRLYEWACSGYMVSTSPPKCVGDIARSPPKLEDNEVLPSTRISILGHLRRKVVNPLLSALAN